MQINGWKDVLELSDVKSADRLQRVNNTLKERKGISIYAEYIKDVMKGVEVSFNKEVFDPYVESISKRFFRTKESKKKVQSQMLYLILMNYWILVKLSHLMKFLMNYHYIQLVVKHSLFKILKRA